MALSPGTVLGHYEISSSLGAGGMGEVYRARDTKLAREVAIKVMPEAVAADPERLARFQREAKSLAALNHANVATLYGLETLVPVLPAGEDSSAGGEGARAAAPIPFLVMELVEGPTLADTIAQGPLEWGQAARLFVEIASGLEAAHERGIVHRDLKPANVKLGVDRVTGASNVKLLDFGLAKAMEAADPSSGGSAADLTRSPTLTLAATMRGEVMGTAGYMAPEQARGALVDKRADVWAFGVCLFEALTGRPTFDGDTVSDRLASVLKEEPDWSALPKDLPPALTTLLARCLEKSPAQRLRDIGEARIALTALLADPEPVAAAKLRAAAAAPLGRGAGVKLLAAVGAAGVAAGLLAMWLLGGGATRPDATAAPAQAVRFSIGNPDGSAFAGVGEIAISPEGRYVVIAGEDPEVSLEEPQPLRLRSLDAFDGQMRVLAGTEGALYPFFSHDGQWIGFFRGPGGQRTLHRLQVESGTIVPITRAPHPGYRAAWGEDGAIVLGAQRDGLLSVEGEVVGGEAITALDASLGEVAHTHPEILPGGRVILFTALAAGASGGRIAAWDRATGEIKTVVRNGGQARYLESGHLLYGYDGALYLVKFDLDRLETVGDPRLVVPGVRMGPLGETSFAVSRDGTLVFLPGGVVTSAAMRLSWIDPSGDLDEEIAQGDLSYPVLDPSGERWVAITPTSLLLFQRGSPLPLELAAGSRPFFGRAVFAPDGAALLFASGPTLPNSRLSRVELRGDAAPVSLGLSAEADFQVVSGVDWRRGEILYQNTRLQGGVRSDSDIWAAAVDGNGPGRPLLASPREEWSARPSHDGALLAFTLRGEDDAARPVGTLYVADYPELERRLPIVESVAFDGFAWGPDGRLWAFDEVRHTMVAITFEREPELRVASLVDAFHTVSFWGERGFDVAPDGRLLVIQGAREATGLAARVQVVVGWMAEQGLKPVG